MNYCKYITIFISDFQEKMCDMLSINVHFLRFENNNK